jgi:hypothetical protein
VSYPPFVVALIFSGLVFPSQPSRLFVVEVEVRPPRSSQGASPKEVIFN